IAGQRDDVLSGAEEGRAVVDDARAAPLGQRGHLGLAVAGAELQLVADGSGVEEVGGVRLVLRLRAQGGVEEEGVVPGDGAVDIGRGVEAALGGELEATFDLRVETREVEAGAEDVSVLSLPGRRLGAEVALVPGGLLRPRRTGVAADLDLVAVEDEGG